MCTQHAEVMQNQTDMNLGFKEIVLPIMRSSVFLLHFPKRVQHALTSGLLNSGGSGFVLQSAVGV